MAAIKKWVLTYVLGPWAGITKKTDAEVLSESIRWEGWKGLYRRTARDDKKRVAVYTYYPEGHVT